MSSKKPTTTVKDILLKTVFTFISISILTAMIFYLYKKEKYGTYSAFLNYEMYQQYVCEIKLTDHFTILKTDDNKFYVKIHSVEDTSSFGFLYGKRNTIDLDLKLHTDFSDSCLAKNFAVTFLEEYNLIDHGEPQENNYSFDSGTLNVRL